jgi:hypothetical protein
MISPVPPPKASKSPLTSPTSVTAKEANIRSAVTKAFAALCAKEHMLPPEATGARYELYTFLFLADILRTKAGHLSRHRLQKSTFLFKTMPWQNPHDFSYCSFVKKGKHYELRNGVEFSGYNMAHEVDISISTPFTSVRPHRRHLLFAVECKYYAKMSGLKGQLRSQVGAALDLAPCHHGRTGCLVCSPGFREHFASQHPIGKRQDFTDYLMRYKVVPLFDFHPTGKDLALATQWVEDLYDSLP